MTKETIPSAPSGYNTVNPFIMTKDAKAMMAFVTAVFKGTELPEALTFDSDGLILHSEVRVGNSIIQIADRKPDWPFTPSLLQVYVDDIEESLKIAKQHGAEVITKPTEFLGAKFSRIKDPQNNLWWIYEYIGEVDWSSSGGEAESGDWKPTKEAIYIHDTLLDAMRGLNKQ